MGSVKDQLIELEDKGVIVWSETYSHYYLFGDNKNKQFNIGEYNRTLGPANSYGRGK